MCGRQIGLPINKRTIPLLCILEPFLARNHLIVTPCVLPSLDLLDLFLTICQES